VKGQRAMTTGGDGAGRGWPETEVSAKRVRDHRYPW
jgi:hypothetical protein